MFVFKGVWKRVVHSYSTIRDDVVKPHCLFFSRMHNLLVSSLVGQSLLSIIKFRTFYMYFEVIFFLFFSFLLIFRSFKKGRKEKRKGGWKGMKKGG